MLLGESSDFDVVVVGSGAAGMTAAITASAAGLNVAVLEKEKQFGGTTARSGGWLWIPLSPQARAAGVEDDLGSVRTYLRACAGEQYEADKVEAYLRNGPEMIEFIGRETDVDFELGHDFADYHPLLPGGKARGRSIVAKQMDAKALGDWLPRLAPALRELSFLGMVIGSGTELKHFFNVTRSIKSAWFASRRLFLHSMDMLRHGRSMRLVNGNALAAGLGKALKDRDIALWLDCPVQSLIQEGGRVTGVNVLREGQLVAVTARRGVVLAAGGFPNDIARRAALFPHTPTGHEHWSLAPRGNTGDGLRLGEAAGGRVKVLPNAAAWAPVSKVKYRDGSEGLYPHFVDRGKPGILSVRANGRRFVNESNSYHDFVQGLYEATPEGQDVRAFFVCDHPTIRQYGLGVAKPFPVPLGPYLRSGYLVRADTLAGLAKKLGIDESAFVATIAEFNQHAVQGRDPLFGRGEGAYNRFQGDGTRKFPSLAPVKDGPFYGVRILPGSLGTYSGLQTDEHARVLDAAGAAIPGLYAAGNDMASVMGGDYPGGGTTLGPAMTFGYVAGKHLSRNAHQ